MIPMWWPTVTRLAVFNIANAAPQVAAPFVASWIVDAGGYDLMFQVAAAISIVGALLVVKVKHVR
ncbi:hypothetical protein [Embleya sp. NPDC005971]|uniref:hypothetical protein n=1 Tax=Embleya sp. NPDC005971 TaxID=3156724 RepID=UPI0033DCC49F